MRKLLSLLILLYACNGAVQNKAAADSTVTSVRTDSAAVVAAPATKQLKVEVAGITQQEFDQYKSAYHNQIERDSLKFPVVNGQITITTDGGKVVLKNNPGVPHDEDRLDYHYAGYLQPLNRYLVQVNGYEHGYCLAIDKATGKQDTLSDMPVISPDGKLILCSKSNPYEEYEHIPPPTQDITIYTVENNVIKKAFLQPYRWLEKELYWKDNHTVYVKSTRGEPENAPVDYLQLVITTGTDIRPAAGAAVSAAWKGTYSTVLNKESKDSRDHINVELKVDGDSVIYTESGFQVYSKYALTGTEKDGMLSFAFKKVLDGGSAVLEKENRFGYVRKENGKYVLECPYLDVRTGATKKEIYPLDKK